MSTKNQQKTPLKTSYTGKEYIINAWFLAPDATVTELKHALGSRIENTSRSNIAKVLYQDIHGDGCTTSELEAHADLSVQHYLMNVMSDDFDTLEPQLTVSETHQFAEFLSDTDTPILTTLVNAWLLAPTKLPRQFVPALTDELNLSNTEIKTTLKNNLKNATLSEHKIEQIANPAFQEVLKQKLEPEITDTTIRTQAPTWYRIHRMIDDKNRLKRHALINIFARCPDIDHATAADLAGCSLTYVTNIASDYQDNITSKEYENAQNTDVQHLLLDILTNSQHDPIQP